MADSRDSVGDEMVDGSLNRAVEPIVLTEMID